VVLKEFVSIEVYPIVVCLIGKGAVEVSGCSCRDEWTGKT
jgi:hypothetical protein